MTGGLGRILISHAPDDPTHTDAVRDLWILLRAGGLDAGLLSGPAELAAAELDSADVVLLIGSPLYRRVAAGDDPAGGAHPELWRAARAIRDLVEGDEKSAAAVLPVVLPGGTVRDLPAFLSAHGGPLHRLRALSRRGVAALVAELHRRCGTVDPTSHHELRLEVSVAQGRLRGTATLAGTPLCQRDEPLPFGRDEVWSLLDLPDAESRLARLGQRLSAALFDADSLDQLTTLVTNADDGTVIDVVIDADGPAHELPFELIRLTDQRVLATVEGVRLIRTVAGVPAAPQPPTPGPLKILVAVGAPEHTENPPLDIEAEMQAIVGVIGGLGRVEVTILEVAGPQEIADALRRDAYHVLHLSAHGSPYGVELEDRDGNAVEVQAEDLVRALRRAGRPVPLIVLSSCDGAADADTGLATTLLRHGANRVIAMQTSVSDAYATRLLTRVYGALAEENVPVAAALAQARSELFDEVVEADSSGRPEYAVPTLFATTDGPLWDATVLPVPLSNPTELPTGAGVRELLLGELVGRRAQLRTVTGTLRDEVPATGQSSLVNGVLLTGVAGIGKTALAGRAINRLRDDIEDPWSVVVHTGSWNPPQLIEDTAATTAGAGIGDRVDQSAALAAITDALRTHRLLIVFDDFEQNLTLGGDAFLDPGFAEVFGELCRAAERGKLLVTSRYPIPAPVPLLRVEMPPLSDAELRRLLLRLPALRELPYSDRETVVRTVGGHPRLVEFVDALLRGRAGKARLPEVTERLRRLARQESVTLARSAADAPDATEATRQAVALAARDMLLGELLDLLTPAEHETLLQAAVIRVRVSGDDLAFAVHDREPSDDDRAEVTAQLDRLLGLTLVISSDDEVVMESWVAEALTHLQGPEHLHRHDRATRMYQRIMQAGRADFQTLTEVVHHLRTAGRFDGLATFTEALLPGLGGELTVAAFLGDVTPGFPTDHPAYLDLLGRERDALEASGSTAAAAVKGEEVLTLVAGIADAEPDNTQAQVALSSALDGQGRLMRRLGRTAEARDHYENALAVDLRLCEADPDDPQYQRNLGLSYQKIAQLALDRAEVRSAREAADRSLQIRRRLVDADPDNEVLHYDLAVCLGVLAAVCRADGDTGQARELGAQALVVWRRLTLADADNQDLLGNLLDGVSALADTIGFLGDDAEQARELTAEAATIADRLATADPGNIAYQRGLLTSHWRLGDMDLSVDDLACAREHFESALSLAERLADTDPDSVDGQCDLATAFRRMADYTAANGQPEEVRGNLERSLEITQGLVHRFPRNGGFHRDLARSCERLADWVRDAGDPDLAGTLFRQALAHWRRRATLDPEDLGARLAQADLNHRIAELEQAAGHPGRARRRWQAALVLAREVHAEAPTEEHRTRVALYQARLD
ncbi:CHAT domain-containing protein [Micromonospora sp. NBC_01796]|uniref:CHAT domain-containing protein n=1 Tax=Micromonospora sp. NBC_01796 TaxID=2975987 RepID=UPI002DDA34B5|nr:CHAT domain-containing protein [Micromonospora sp. NBC_01796]WSA85193.1 CHAT domain-containing protein [Micromonospora sp. NBC_01796]